MWATLRGPLTHGLLSCAACGALVYSGPTSCLTDSFPNKPVDVAWKEQHYLSSLSVVLAPAVGAAPPGVGVRCRRCYCLFKFTQEPLKEPQGPLVRLPTLKTSKSLKIH